MRLFGTTKSIFIGTAIGWNIARELSSDDTSKAAKCREATAWNLDCRKIWTDELAALSSQITSLALLVELPEKSP